MKRRKFSNCLNEHWRARGRGRMVAKVGYDTEEEAQCFMSETKVPEQYKAYKCSQCGKWHVGHTH